MNKKAVIFDLDGTLLDTRRDLYNAVNFALRENGLKEITFEDAIKYTGLGIKRLCYDASQGASDDVKENVLKKFKEYYLDHSMDLTVPYDGIMELLDYLKKKGIKIAVVSNKADFLVKRIVSNYFGNMFDFVSGARDNMPLKPSPDVVNLCLREIGTKREDSVYIGDTIVDLETADNSHMDHIICTYGFRSKESLLEIGAKRYVDSPLEIREYL